MLRFLIFFGYSFKSIFNFFKSSNNPYTYSCFLVVKEVDKASHQGYMDGTMGNQFNLRVFAERPWKPDLSKKFEENSTVTVNLI